MGKKCEPNSRVRLMFQDEAGFGRINKPKRCWCNKKIRPSVPCHHIREYRYAYGAVEPMTGDNFFLVMPYCSTNCMNTFLEKLAKQYPQDQILLVCDGAAWHKSKMLNHVVDRLCDTICDLTNDMVKSITCRQWISDAFLI